MRLDKLRLKNFRCFSDIEIDLNEKLTVLVAENGQGKSALLDAIRIALWPFVSSFDIARNAKNDPANGISIADVRLIKMSHGDMARQLPSEVAMTGDFGMGNTATWVRYRDKETKSTKTKDDGDTSKMKSCAAAIQTQIRDPKKPTIDLPVFGYYGTGRLWSQKKLTEANKGKDDTKENDFYVRTFAYLNCLDPASSYKHFKEWFTWAFESLREQQIHNMEGRSNAEELHASKDRIRVVQQVIDTFLKPVAGWHTLEYSVSREKSLVLHHDELGVLDVDQLSDGIRSVLAMVGDIAYRCIKLNPQLGVDAALETYGVVMIDEVDMHLHPRWQQVVIAQLQEAFPKVQFIVTTHSPQVLTTVPRESIRLLQERWSSDAEEWRDSADTPAYQVKGTASSDALIHLMGTNPQPNVEEAQWIADYSAAIENGTHEDAVGRALREKLIAFYGPDHPVLLDADRLIRFQSLKLRKRQADKS